MAATSQYLYKFLSACSGNWRNTIYIACNSKQNDPGYLLTADRDGHPVVIAIEQFQQLTDEQIDPAECCGQITETSFKALYAQHLIWHIPSDDVNPFRQPSRELQGLE